jgi:hypothetical protein
VRPAGAASRVSARVGLGRGRHVWWVNAVDAAGNLTSSPRRAFSAR